MNDNRKRQRIEFALDYEDNILLQQKAIELGMKAKDKNKAASMIVRECLHNNTVRAISPELADKIAFAGSAVETVKTFITVNRIEYPDYKNLEKANNIMGDIRDVYGRK